MTMTTAAAPPASGIAALFQKISSAAVKAWDEVKAGVKWLTNEAEVIEAWLKDKEPEVVAAAQKVIADGEAGAAYVAQYAGDALGQAVTTAAPGIEEAVIGHLSNVLGGNAAQQLETAAGHSLLADGATVLHKLIDVNVAKFVSAMGESRLVPGEDEPGTAVPVSAG